MIRVTIPGRAVGKGSPRAALRGRYPVIYYSDKTEDWMKKVALLARKEYRLEPLQGPLGVIIEVTIKPGMRPYTHAEPVDGDYPTLPPDCDNYSKGILDACNGILWKDDSQVCTLMITKRFGDIDQTVVSVEKLNDEPSQTRMF